MEQIQGQVTIWHLEVQALAGDDKPSKLLDQGCVPHTGLVIQKGLCEVHQAAGVKHGGSSPVVCQLLQYRIHGNSTGQTGCPTVAEVDWF